MDRVNGNNRRRVGSTKSSRNTWGDSSLKFGVLDSLGADAIAFMNSVLPSNEDIVTTLPLVAVEDVEIEETPGLALVKRRKLKESNDDELFGEVGAERVPLHILDGFIATFIQDVRFAYAESSAIVLKYLQILLYVHLVGFMRLNAGYPNSNWTIRTIKCLFKESPKSFDRFVRIMSPQRLSRLYYGLHNLLYSVHQKEAIASTPTEKERLEKFKTFMLQVKHEINNEIELEKYLKFMSELAKCYKNESLSLHKKLEKLNEMNSFIPPTNKGRLLRVKVHSFLVIPLPGKDNHLESQLLTIGDSMKHITDKVPPLEELMPEPVIVSPGPALASAPAIAAAPLGVSQPNRGDMIKTLVTSLKQSSIITNKKQFVIDAMDLSLYYNAPHLTFQQKIEKLNKVVNAIPVEEYAIRSVIYNLFPVTLTVDIIRNITNKNGVNVPPATSLSDTVSSAPVNESTTVNATELSSSSSIASVQSPTRRMGSEFEKLLFNAAAKVSMDDGSSEVPIVPPNQISVSVDSISPAKIPEALVLPQTLPSNSSPITLPITKSADSPLNPRAYDEDLFPEQNGHSSPLLSIDLVDSQSASLPVSIQTTQSKSNVFDSQPIILPTKPVKQLQSPTKSTTTKMSITPVKVQANKRPRLEFDGTFVTISFKEASGNVLTFKTKKSSAMMKVFKTYSTCSGIQLNSVRFSINGCFLSGDEVVEDMKFTEDNNTILVVNVGEH